MKKVLIITYYWPPSGGAGVQRWVKFSKYLKDFDIEPIVFTIDDNSNYLSIDESLLEEVRDVKTIKSKVWEPINFYNSLMGKNNHISINFLSEGRKLSFKEKIAIVVRGNLFIPDAKCLWIPSAKSRINDYLKDKSIDLVISTGPPHTCHIIGRYIKNKFKIPWIVDFRDPWTQIDYFNELRLSYLTKLIHRKLEKSVLDNADGIISVGEEMIKDFRKLTDNKNFYYIPNGYDDEDISQDQKSELNEEFTISYIGTMNTARNPIELWEELQKLFINNPDVFNKIRIQIVGQVEPIVMDSIKKYNLEKKVELLGYKSHKEALHITSQSHLLLLVINRTHNAKTILTGKLFEYLASKKPILCIGPQNGEAAKIINECNAGRVFEFNNSKGMSEFLIDQFMNYNQTTDLTKVANYSRRNLTNKLAEIIKNLTNV